MKNVLFRIPFLIIALIATIYACDLSIKIERASRAPILFEECGKPITFGRLYKITKQWGYSSEHATLWLDVCINNLRQLNASKEEWALENNAKPGNIVTWKDINQYFRTNYEYGGSCGVRTAEFTDWVALANPLLVPSPITSCNRDDFLSFLNS